MTDDGPWWERAAKAVHHALGEFLAVPIAVVTIFLLLAAGVYFIDAAFWSPDQKPPSQLHWLGHVFGDSAALSSLLSTIATSLITVTSITFSLLLVAVQQAASALTNQVFDQFLRRRGNQIYFGFFVGLSVFALINLVVASQSHRPIFGALIAVLLTGVALCLIVVLIYTTIDQMRADTIIEAIRVHVLSARENQLVLLQATRRRTASQTLRVARQVVSERQGYVTAVNVDQIARAVASAERIRKSAGDVRVSHRGRAMRRGRKSRGVPRPVGRSEMRRRSDRRQRPFESSCRSDHVGQCPRLRTRPRLRNRATRNYRLDIRFHSAVQSQSRYSGLPRAARRPRPMAGTG